VLAVRGEGDVTPGRPEYAVAGAEERVVAILQRQKRVGRSEPLTSTQLGIRARISHSHARSIANRLVKQGRARLVGVQAGTIVRAAWVWE